MNCVRKINEGIAKFEKAVLMVMLGAMLILGILQVVMREVVRAPLAWSEGLLTYLFIWSSFIGAALGMKNMQHFCIDALVDKFPKKVQRIIERFIFLLIVAVAVFVLSKGIGLALAQRMIRMPMMKGSMMLPYFSVPTSFCLMGLHSICNFILTFEKEETR